MSDHQHPKQNIQFEDETQNPVYRFGQAVAKFMLFIWACVLALVFFLVFRFWLK